MSFKSEAANVRAGLNSGSYKKKVDPFKGFFEELTYGLKKRDEEKRQEEKEKRQQARAVARATKAKQDAEDKAEKKRTELANFYLISTGKSPTPQNKAALRTVITGGNFTDFGSLDKHMSQYSTYNPGTPQDNIDSQMQSAGLLQPGDGPYIAKTEEANNLSPEGTIKFTGKQEVVDLEGLTETNYLPRLRTAELLGAKGAKTVEEIKRIAIQSGWDKKINGVSTMDMAGKPSAYFEDLLEQVNPTTAADDFTFLQGRLDDARVREADPKFWEDPAKLSTYPANTLEAFIGTGKYQVGSEAYKAINGFLLIRRVQEGDADISTLAGAGAQKIDQFIKANSGTLLPKQLNTLTDMRSIALEYEAKGQESATSKQMAQEAYIAAKSVDKLQGQARFEAMANFEKSWKIATDTSTADPQFWQKPEELAKIDPVVLKTMMDAGLLGVPTSAAYKAVEATYNTKSGIQIGDLSQLQGKSVVQFDQYMVSNADYFVDNPAAAFEFHKMRSLQVAQEQSDAPDERLLTAKQIALDAFMEQNTTSELSGDDLMNKMAEFEKTWDAASKEVAAKMETYTTSNYAADLIKFGGMLESSNKVDQKSASDWFTTTKPIIDKTLASIANLDNQSKIAALVAGGIDEPRATSIVNGTIRVTSDGLGRPLLLDTSTGNIFNIVGGESTSDATARVVGETLTEEDRATLEEAKKEMANALGNAGFGIQLDNLEDISAAFGPEGWAGKVTNKVAGLFNTTYMPDTANARTALAALNKVTKFNIISAFPGLRDSVALKAEVESLFTQTGKFWSSKPEAFKTMTSIKSLLDQAIATNKQRATSRDVTTTENSKGATALISLEPLSVLYGKVIAQMDGEAEVITKKPPVGRYVKTRQSIGSKTNGD